VPIYALDGYEPDIDASAFVHPDAVVIGRVWIGPEASVWPCAVLHTTERWPTIIGAECVVGHNAHLEGCVVEDRCLIGSGSVTLNRATVYTGAIVAAGTLVPEGFEVPSASLVAGVPAKIKRTGLPGGWTEQAVKTYVESARHYRTGLRRIG
jgi:carbonic anhydrase/acetyltransferase-like protein (isoleucine patch superfamily)